MHEIDFKIPPWWLKHQPGEKTRHLFELYKKVVTWVVGVHMGSSENGVITPIPLKSNGVSSFFQLRLSSWGCSPIFRYTCVNADNQLQQSLGV